MDQLHLVVKCCKITYHKSIRHHWQTLQGHILHILQHFATKLCSFTNFRMLFNAVVMNFTISIFLKTLSIMQSVHSSHNNQLGRYQLGPLQKANNLFNNYVKNNSYSLLSMLSRLSFMLMCLHVMQLFDSPCQDMNNYTLLVVY